jgi:hypothetical protein
MNKKLTLLLNETTIERAKKYADRHKETLSGMVEKYFEFLTSKEPENKKKTVPKIIEDLTGIVSIPEETNIKEEYRQHRAGKASHD